ncbi:MAG: serine/threonine protein kinase [Pirellulales bacterium]
MPLVIGSYIGPYRLLNLIITGQSSAVWEALHEGKQQRFAIKVLLDDTRTDREQRGYMANEWNVGRMLSHPRVIRMVEYSQQNGLPYLALELFRVPNLKTWMRNNPRQLPPLVQQIVRQAADGLSHLHEKGWIHRDIKPDNLLVSPEGECKLVDFALAQRPTGFLAKLLKRRGKIQGTRSYISPEQIRGGALDFRSDIYNFGCMLHELLGGKPPYTGADTNDLLNKHLSASIPVLEASNRNVTSEFADLVRRMLAKQPQKRPASMADVLQELNSIRVYKETPKIVEEEA